VAAIEGAGRATPDEATSTAAAGALPAGRDFGAALFDSAQTADLPLR
jgi:hypothetical protein